MFSGAKLATTDDETGVTPSSGQKLKRYCEGAKPVVGSRLADTFTLTVFPWIFTELEGRTVEVTTGEVIDRGRRPQAELSETITSASNLTLGRSVNGPGGRLPLRSIPHT